MGDGSSTAQVHPQKLSQALMDAAQQKGAHLCIEEVQNIITSGKKITGVRSHLLRKASSTASQPQDVDGKHGCGSLACSSSMQPAVLIALLQCCVMV